MISSAAHPQAAAYLQAACEMGELQAFCRMWIARTNLHFQTTRAEDIDRRRRMKALDSRPLP